MTSLKRVLKGAAIALALAGTAIATTGTASAQGGYYNNDGYPNGYNGQDGYNNGNPYGGDYNNQGGLSLPTTISGRIDGEVRPGRRLQ